MLKSRILNENQRKFPKMAKKFKKTLYEFLNRSISQYLFSGRARSRRLHTHARFINGRTIVQRPIPKKNNCKQSHFSFGVALHFHPDPHKELEVRRAGLKIQGIKVSCSLKEFSTNSLVALTFLNMIELDYKLPSQFQQRKV